MADSRVEADGGSSKTPGARSVLTGADRASGERVRRRRQVTPLLTDRYPADAELRARAGQPREPAASTESASSAEPDPSPEPVHPEPLQTELVETEKSPPVEEIVDQPTATPKAVSRKAATGKTANQAAPKKAARKPAKEVVTKKAATRAPAKKASAQRPPARTASAPKSAAKKSAPAKRTAAAKSHPGRTDLSRISRPLSSVPVGVPQSPESSKPPATAPRPSAASRSAATLSDEPLPAGGRHSIALAVVSQVGEALLDAVTSRARASDIEAKVAALLSFLRRRLSGDYELDEFGFDQEFSEAVPLNLLRPIYRHWFRVDVRGIENIPSTGGALIVANHSGALPMDALMTCVAVHDEHPKHRFLRTLGADLVFQTPFLAGFARRSGATLASNPDAERLLSEGHLVGVWPEGFKGIGKPFTERYKLQRFGRGGFVSAALRTGTPIIPCSIVGAEEIFPIIGNVPSLARLLGLPYLPITPFFPLLGPLGAIPLPSKWLIEFGPPVPTDEFDPGTAEDPMLVFDLTDQVRQSIQQTLYSLLVQRRSIFF
jgi:1-acyl-sn-glycerol-3-phosphate acyltransferase